MHPIMDNSKQIHDQQDFMANHIFQRVAKPFKGNNLVDKIFKKKKKNVRERKTDWSLNPLKYTAVVNIQFKPTISVTNHTTESHLNSSP